jgi:hypothetical protein
MKTVSICISAVVVILLNANFFQIYRSISTNEVQKNLIADAGVKILEQSRKKAEQNPPTDVDVKKEFDKTKAEIDAYVNNYQEFGFKPLSAVQFRSWLWSIGGWTIFSPPLDWYSIGGFSINRDNKGVPINNSGNPIYPDCSPSSADCNPAWHIQSRGEWWDARKRDVTVLFGWTVMVLLLSVGAPFWQDTLESLFGIKNLLRQKSATQNVEEESGTGQTKQA